MEKLNDEEEQKRRSKRTKADTSQKSKYFKSDDASVPVKLTSTNSGVSPSDRDMDKKLNYNFFNAPCALLAVSLLGKTLVRKIGSQRISGTIAETEAYLGLEDKAAHSYQGKRTERNEAMFMTPGTAYVYNIYGMYCCFNISSAGEGCAVLIRALEPIDGIPEMRAIRCKSSKKNQKDSALTNGPSKLCQALQINKNSCNKIDLTSSEELWLENGYDVPPNKIVHCPRINIGYAEEWVDKPYRFYIEGNSCVSVKHKSS